MTVTVAPDDALVAGPARSVAAFLRRHRWSLGGAALSGLVIALVWLASIPTGASSAARTIPDGSRLAARAHVGDVEVLIVSKQGALSVQIAYPSAKGWLGAPLRAAPSNAVAAWTGTTGNGPIPAMAIVYGRAPGSSVEIVWGDGRHTRVRAASDGVYVAARNRYIESAKVRVFDDKGGTILEIDGP